MQHSSKVRESYARFLMVVISAYQQMRNQKEPVLSELGEDNFDRAFSFVKPGKVPPILLAFSVLLLLLLPPMDSHRSEVGHTNDVINLQ